MGTDWLVKVKRPRPKKKITNAQDHIAACSGCPYVIWEKPEPVAGFMSSMCAVRIGSIGMAAELDAIGEYLTGIDWFTKHNGNTFEKLGILNKIRSYAQNSLWSFNGFTREETLEHLDLLIDFCNRAKAKGLEILAWA